MSTRALSRSGQPAAPLIDLPTAFRPQVVNSEGYELSQEDIASSQQAFRGTDEFEGTPDVSSKDDTKADVDENDLDDAEEPQTEKSLLSLADTYVVKAVLSRRVPILSYLYPAWSYLTH